MELEIRLAGPDDLASAAEVTVAGYRARGLLEGTEAGYADQLADTPARAREAELYVAVRDGVVVGSVTFCPHGSPWGEIAEEGEAEFRMLSVAPDASGAGVGSALTQRCVDRARELCCRALVLSSLPQMSEAHRLYERLGFVRLPERDWRPVPEVLLIAYRLEL